jgi:hypothetical protein
MPTPIELAAATLPEGTCFPGNMQDLLALIVGNIQASLEDTVTLFNFGPNTPAVDRQDQPWIRTNSVGKFLGVYTFTNGQWEPADPPYTTGDIMAFNGDPSLILPPWWVCNGQTITVNGTQYTLPNLQGTFLIGVGQRTLPNGSADTATTYELAQPGGNETHLITPAELPYSFITDGPANNTTDPNLPLASVSTTQTRGNYVPPYFPVNWKMYIQGSATS